MQFLILRSENLIAVENQEIAYDCSSLPSNVEMVGYHRDEGKLEYNDRPAMPTPFTDPSPYQSFINAWITAAAALTPPLQLAQAKQVKKDLVEAIFHHKRRVPYLHSDGWLYDAHDDAVINMHTLAQNYSTLTLSELITSINTAFATITSQVNNGPIYIGNLNVTANNASAAAINAWSLVHHTNWNYNGTYAQGGFAIQTSLTYDTAIFLPTKTPGYGGFGTHSGYSNIAGATVAGGGSIIQTGNISMQPLNSSTAVNIPAGNVALAMVNIASRYNQLNTNRQSKQRAIDALATIPAIAAYDATTGWAA